MASPRESGVSASLGGFAGLVALVALVTLVAVIANPSIYRTAGSGAAARAMRAARVLAHDRTTTTHAPNPSGTAPGARGAGLEPIRSSLTPHGALARHLGAIAPTVHVEAERASGPTSGAATNTTTTATTTGPGAPSPTIEPGNPPTTTKPTTTTVGPTTSTVGPTTTTVGPTTTTRRQTTTTTRPPTTTTTRRGRNPTTTTPAVP